MIQYNQLSKTNKKQDWNAQREITATQRQEIEIGNWDEGKERGKNSETFCSKDR